VGSSEHDNKTSEFIKRRLISRPQGHYSLLMRDLLCGIKTYKYDNNEKV
jgi:hypothetical protein